MLSHGSTARKIQRTLYETDSAVTEFRTLLASVGPSATLPNPRHVWETFKRFASMPFRCEDDALLLQCGQFGLSSREPFHVDFVRQFTLDADYQRVEQLHCEFTFAMIPALRGRETFVWSYYSENLQAFFARVQNLPLWNVLAPLVPGGFSIYLEAQ